MQLTTIQQEQYKQWVEQVHEHEFGLLKWAEALWKIKQSGFWKTESESWPEYCESKFGYCRAKAYQWPALVEFIKKQEALAQTNPEIEVPKTLNQAKKLKAKASLPPVDCKKLVPTKTINLEPIMPARHDQSGPPIQFKTPPVLPMDLASVMAAIFRDVDKLIHRSDFSYESLQILYRLAGEVKQAQHLLQGVLPGFEDVASRPKFKVPSKEEVVKYCVSVGLKASDGEYFHDTKQGCGWMNAGKKIVEWQAVVRAWKHANHFQSQKQVNGYGKTVPKEKSLLQKQTEKAIRQIEQI